MTRMSFPKWKRTQEMPEDTNSRIDQIDQNVEELILATQQQNLVSPGITNHGPSYTHFPNIGIDKFDPKRVTRSRFSNWKEDFLSYVDVVAFTMPESRKMNLLSLMSDDSTFKSVVRSSSSLTEALNKLEERFGKSSAEKDLEAYEVFSNFCPKLNENLRDLLLRFQESLNKLKQRGLMASNEMIMLKLKKLLPKEVRVQLKLYEPDEDIEEIITDLIDDYGETVCVPNRLKEKSPRKTEQCRFCNEKWFPGHKCKERTRVNKVTALPEVNRVITCVVDTGAGVNVFGKACAPHARLTGKKRTVQGAFGSRPVTLPEATVRVCSGEEVIEIGGVIDRSANSVLINPEALQVDSSQGVMTLKGKRFPVRKTGNVILSSLELDNPKRAPLSQGTVLQCLGVDIKCLHSVQWAHAFGFGLRCLHRRLLHPCSHRLYETIRSVCPRLPVKLKEIEEAVGKCGLCMLRNSRHEPVNIQSNFERSDLRFSADIAEVEDPSSEGHRYISVVKEGHSGEVFLSPLRSKAEVKDHVKKVLGKFSNKVSSFLSDQAKEYIALTPWLSERGIRHILPPKTSNESCGIIEVAVREVKRYLRTASDEFKMPFSEWNNLVPAVETAMNSTYQTKVKNVPWIYTRENLLSMLPTDLVVVKTEMDNATPEHPGTSGYFIGWKSEKTCLVYFETPEGSWMAREVHSRSVKPVPRLPKISKQALREEGNGSLFLEDEYDGTVSVFALSEVSQRAASRGEIKGEEFRKAEKQELEKFFKFDALRPVSSVPKNSKVLPTMFVYTWKKNEEGWVPKARLVVRGDLDEKELPSTVALCTTEFRTLGLICGLGLHTKMYVADVSSAFLHSPIDFECFVKIQGKVYQLKKAVYGLKTAPRAFVKYVEEGLRERGWKSMFPGVWSRDTQQILHYVDDFYLFTNDIASLMKELRSFLMLDDPTQIDRASIRYVGQSISRTSCGLQLSLESYLKTIPGALTAVSGKLSFNAINCDESLSPDPTLLPGIRKKLGILGYIASFDPTLAYVFSHLSSVAVSHPCPKMDRAVALALKVATVRPPFNLELNWYDSFDLVLYTDASYNVSKRTGRAGYALFLWPQGEKRSVSHNLLTFGSHKIQRLVKSTLAAELEAVVQGLQETSRLLHYIKKSPLKISRIILRVDNKPLTMCLDRGVTQDGFSIDDLHLAVQEITKRGIKVEWVSTTEQLADVLTKFFPQLPFGKTGNVVDQEVE